MKSTGNPSRQCRIAAQDIASILYGVIAIMTADLAAQPGKFGYIDAGVGVFLIGLAMTLTRFFVKVVTKEAELGAHLSAAELMPALRDSLWVMIFPAITVLLIAVGALATAGWKALLDDILYIGMATVFVIGFLSSYVLDRDFRLALRRAFVWLLLSVIIVAAKAFA